MTTSQLHHSPKIHFNISMFVHHHHARYILIITQSSLLAKTLAKAIGTVWLKIHPGLVDTFLNFLHKSLNHQTPVTGTWLALERKVKVTSWKVKAFFPLLRYLPIVMVRFGSVSVNCETTQKQPKMSLEKVVNFFLAWHLLSTARHLSYLTAHLHSQPSLINRLTCLKG